MKEKIQAIVAITILVVLVGVGFFIANSYKGGENKPPKEDTKIELYGEYHGIKDFYEIEYNLWKERYDAGQRILFCELPYFSGEFLNEWMKADNDELLDKCFEELKGTLAGNRHHKKFLSKIKKNCPETVFVGTDVGHQYDTTGQRYLEFLRSKGLEDSENYKLAEECIKQGEEYYNSFVDPYNAGDGDSLRELYMTENFFDAYDRVGRVKIMGIYGADHTALNNELNMIAPIISRFGDEVSSVSVLSLYFDKKPYNFGFCVSGLVFLLMLMIPNFLWTRNQPKGYSKFAKNENKILLTLERVGEVLVTTILVIFTDFNPTFKIKCWSVLASPRVYFWALAFILMILYECFWIRYFKSRKTMQDFYSSFAGFPVAGASLPVFAVLILAIYGKNLILLGAGIILGIGHIGIHLGHKKEIMNTLTSGGY